MQLDPLLKLSCAIARNRDKIEFDLVCEFEFELVFNFGASGLRGVWASRLRGFAAGLRGLAASRLSGLMPQARVSSLGTFFARGPVVIQDAHPSPL